MVGVIDGFRWCLLGGESRLYWPGLGLGLAITSFFLWLGLRQFGKMERSFADLIGASPFAIAMSDIIIAAENLSKSYLVGHQSAERERYIALRDVIAREARNFARKGLDFVRGRQIVQGDEVEEFWALRDVSFEVRRGEVLGIIGRNGAGKSTLLKILSRITEPTRGRVTIRGRVASLLEVGTGFHPELTGRENIYLNGAILGMSQREIRKKFDEIVAFAEVEQFLDTPVKRYSSGMYVRLAFAVAAHLEPEILIVDEVLAVGDAAFQKKCLGKMGEVASREGRTVLFVSHNVAAVESLCSSGLLLEMGSLRKSGLPPAVIAEYLNLSATRLSAAPQKRGSQYIRSFVMKDRLGIARDSFQIGEDIIFEIELHSDAPIDHPRYGIGIHNLRGERVTTLHTDVQQNEKWKLNGTKLMRAVWRNVPLNVGQYRVDTALWGYDYEIETLTGCKILEMQARDVYKTGFLLDPTYQGYLIPDAHWEMNLEQRGQSQGVWNPAHK